MISAEAFFRLFLIFGVHFYLSAVWPKSHSLWNMCELSFPISKLILRNLMEATTSQPLNLAYCASAVRCQTDGISDQQRVMT